jgi:hypothetical protein
MTDPLRELLREILEAERGVWDMSPEGRACVAKCERALAQRPEPVAYRFRDPSDFCPPNETWWAYEDEPEFLERRRKEGLTLEPLYTFPPSAAALIAEKDAEMLRVKACEHIAEGDEGWEKLRNECPSTVAVAVLRDKYEAAERALAGAKAQTRLEALRENIDVERFRDRPPCYICGYGGHSYFQPSVHECAKWYHAASEHERS